MRTSFISFPTSAGLNVAGLLRTPREAGDPVGAVLICHGSDGVDGRGEYYAGALNAAGFATLEIDMWAARSTSRGAAGRPRSPMETLPDAFGALKFLGEQPEIDPARVGILGFSWGGVVSLLSATKGRADPLRGDLAGFAAHVAHYPVCYAYAADPRMALTDLTGAPILIQTGDIDTYDHPDAGEKLAAALAAQGTAPVRNITYAGAGHGFDRDLPAQTINDPFAHNGAGGPVLMEFNKPAAEAARAEVVAFFTAAF
ncbi:MAG: dienelactone hydrolase family protein [Phenylobacterium sp.]|uniref:dienelactone hydrolase family protein n=1 Tax=Phenylobacterium sp. TaxID=1871053 RepID=UPI002724008C|nr:dienelactone hydrolase family protein [Phenylobacterium sp.]MDO8910472.1 dienelactone hydrolase family protein [Phenylobacterium sp.]MDP3101301.1 dienelactone hydrolase family protein [Phenylobacterium sp.]MDP3867478.1 dienelactone hydrolase family protein [Phenylobacterium sp.]